MDEAEDWRPRLRRARRDLHINLKDVAAATGLSYETLRGYENGRRRPTRDNLIRVLDAMDVPYIEANEILNDAGFAGRRTRFPEDEFPSYYFSRNELASAVETVGWPQFVVGNLMEVCAANTAAQALWGVDFEYEQRTRTRAQMTLLSVASDHHFADRLGNWDEVLRTMAGLFKGRPEQPESLDAPSTFLAEVLQEFAKGDPAFLAGIAAAFAEAEAWVAKVRQQYRVVWIDRDFGEMRFQGVMTTCSEPDALSFNDWHPMDADSWRVLEQVKSRGTAGARRR